MSDSKVNGIVILDAVPKGELNTAIRLKEEIEDIACYFTAGLQVRYIRAENIESLETGILNILDEIERNGLLPWIHLDGHGLTDQSGFVLADGSQCLWRKLKELITPLNVAADFNLMLILATCFGGSFASAIDTTDRAPVLGLLGPTKEVSVGHVESSFPAFYKVFFKTFSLEKAREELNKRSSRNLYYGTTAEQFFYTVWKGYKIDYCSNEMLNKRAREIYREAKRKKIPGT